VLAVARYPRITAFAALRLAPVFPSALNSDILRACGRQRTQQVSASISPCLQLRMPRQIPALTSLRFIAALMVMFGHTMGHFYSGFDYAGVTYAALSNLAQMGMSLFFVLSGFVISYNYTSLGSLRPAELKRFAVARVARIYPAYIAVLLFNNWVWSWNYVTPTGLLAHLTLTQDWFMDTVGGISLISQFHNAEVTWSISAEWFCYLLFPFICFALDRIRRPLLALVLTWFIIIAYMYGIGLAAHRISQDDFKFVEWLGYYSPYIRLSEFLIGCFVFRIGAAMPAPSTGERRRIAPLIALGAIIWLGIAAVLLNSPGALSIYGWCGGYTLGAALLIFWCSRYGGSFLDNRWLEMAGNASYSFYLLHTLIVVGFIGLMPTPTNDGLLATAVIVSAIAANLVLSLISFRVFERPARDAIRYAFGSKPAVAAIRP
jgi:peptidoglycan/LPS O-acetylase OafA/YrhL